MLSREFRPQVSALTAPAAAALRRIGVSPNALTMAGLALSVAAAFGYAGGRTRLAGLFLLLSGLGDMLDGPLARISPTPNGFGGFLDSVADRYSEFIVFLGLLYRFHADADTQGVVLVYLALLGSVMVSYTRARAESIIPKCDVGFMERPERIILLILCSFLDQLRPALWLLAVGANLTALHRIAHTHAEVGRHDGG